MITRSFLVIQFFAAKNDLGDICQIIQCKPQQVPTVRPFRGRLILGIIIHKAVTAPIAHTHVDHLTDRTVTAKQNPKFCHWSKNVQVETKFITEISKLKYTRQLDNCFGLTSATSTSEENPAVYLVNRWHVGRLPSTFLIRNGVQLISSVLTGGSTATGFDLVCSFSPHLDRWVFPSSTVRDGPRGVYIIRNWKRSGISGTVFQAEFQIGVVTVLNVIAFDDLSGLGFPPKSLYNFFYNWFAWFFS